MIAVRMLFYAGSHCAIFCWQIKRYIMFAVRVLLYAVSQNVAHCLQLDRLLDQQSEYQKLFGFDFRFAWVPPR